MMSGTYKALLIGVHEFTVDPANLLPLIGPRHDVPALRAALSHRETGLVADNNIQALLNPTKAEAEHAIHALFVSGQRDDVLMFYFSGHGRLSRDGKLFLCARDTDTQQLPVTGIAATTLRDCMEASESQRFVVILDCCHSGAFRGGALPIEVLGGRGMFCLSSSRASQLADDGGGDGPSPFTAAVASALCDPAIDGDDDGWITFDDVYRVTYARLARTRQFPQRSTGEGTVALARTSPSVQSGPLPSPVRESGRIATPGSHARSVPADARPADPAATSVDEGERKHIDDRPRRPVGAKVRRWRLVLAAAIVVVGVGGFLYLERARSGIPDRFPRLRDQATLRCLDSNAEGRVYTIDCNGDNSQQWNRTRLRYGNQIHDGVTARCLDSNISGEVYTLPCNGGSFQQWTLDADVYGYVIKDVATGRCLDSNTDGKVYAFECNGDNFQHWKP